MNWFKLFCQREYLLHCRQPRSLLQTWLFFIMVFMTLPLAIAPDPTQLHTLLVSFLWIVMLLAMLFSSESLFQQDLDNGFLEQCILAKQHHANEPFLSYVLAKLVIHGLILTSGVILCFTLIGVMFQLSWREIFLADLCLSLGAPCLFLLCALASAFTLGTSQKGIMMTVVILPLAVPLIIFGSACIAACLQGFMVNAYLALLLALSLLSMLLLPRVIAAAVRIKILLTLI